MYYTGNEINGQLTLQVQIVRGKLVRVGHVDKFNNLLGWVWFNKTDARQYVEDEELFKIMKEINDQDPDFFEFLCEKLQPYYFTKGRISADLFRKEVEKRDRIANTETHEVNMVVYNVNDYGQRSGVPISKTTVVSCGDYIADVKKAVENVIGKYNGFYGASYYNADMKEQIKNEIARAELGIIL